jgi:methylenetetrahydrofolate reductase (NADPH)
MISFELIPRDTDSIQKQLDFLKTKPIFDAINIPDLIRFPTRSWEVNVPENYDFIPHIRVIDFNLKKDTLFSLIKSYKLKQVLLITGEKSSSYNRPVYRSSILEAIDLLKKEFPELIISVAVDQYRNSLKEEIDYLNDKLNAGADFIFSQPFFNTSLINTYLDYIDADKFFIGISPVVTEKSRLYWENVNQVLFDKTFSCSYEWNIDFINKVFDETKFKHLYFMPIGVDLEKYFKDLY